MSPPGRFQKLFSTFFSKMGGAWHASCCRPTWPSKKKCKKTKKTLAPVLNSGNVLGMNITLPCVEIITPSVCVLPLLDIEIEGEGDWSEEDYSRRYWLSGFTVDSFTVIDQNGNVRSEFNEVVAEWLAANEKEILSRAEDELDKGE